MSGGIKLDIAGLEKGFGDLEILTTKATEMYGEVAGTKMASDAKVNAPWTDRTGNSRQTIDHVVTTRDKQVTIQLRGNTPHFKYLELAMEKRFAILWPTIQKWQSEVVRAWSNLIWK